MSRLGSNNPNWKDGPRIWGGYVYLHAPKHPRAEAGRVREHVLIAEKALGRYLPVHAVVHHVNEIKTDNRNENLVICQDNAYHGLLHARARVLRLGGDPDTDKVCAKCQTVKHGTEFSRHSRGYMGLQSMCRACVAMDQRLGRQSEERKRKYNMWKQEWRKRNGRH